MHVASEIARSYRARRASILRRVSNAGGRRGSRMGNIHVRRGGGRSRRRMAGVVWSVRLAVFRQSVSVRAKTQMGRREGPYGNARGLFLCAPQHDVFRDCRLSEGTHYGMVSASSKRENADPMELGRDNARRPAAIAGGERRESLLRREGSGLLAAARRKSGRKAAV